MRHGDARMVMTLDAPLALAIYPHAYVPELSLALRVLHAASAAASLVRRRQAALRRAAHSPPAKAAPSRVRQFVLGHACGVSTHARCE